MQIINVSMEPKSGVTTSVLALLQGYRARSINAFLLTTSERKDGYTKRGIPLDWMIGISQFMPRQNGIYLVDDASLIEREWARIYPIDDGLRTYASAVCPTAKIFMFDAR
ncbi:hypothetical protein C3Z09_22295 [Lelliottia aquatilis]|uniref:hypothetical protein n=1 Tax=Lelliottia aquatilis TaxID=2080838 RepID=UPI000CDE7C82|nr:hypothetical protein [Lelliottia aquatilis]NTZ48378.1 hypothetical protein [Lelliottia aquatilis]POZ13671.1 hypothetical protein C3Z09_22295 [Lelliottia aquatilis]